MQLATSEQEGTVWVGVKEIVTVAVSVSVAVDVLVSDTVAVGVADTVAVCVYSQKHISVCHGISTEVLAVKYTDTTERVQPIIVPPAIIGTL